MKGKELERLIGRHLDGELTEAEAEVLSGALETSAAAREVFWEMAAVHGLTQEATRLEWLDAAGPGEVRGGGGGSLVRWVAPLAAAAVLVAGIFLWPDDGAVEVPVAGVAVLSRVVGVLDAELGGEVRRAGDVLERGELRLGSGAVMVEFYSGARVVLEGPAAFEVVSESEGYLKSGKLTAQVPPQAKGFTVGAEGLKVVDLGTAFGMSAGDAGAAEVHVFDGEVEVEVPGEPKVAVDGGEALRIAARGLEAIDADGAGFLDEVEFAELEAEAAAVRRAAWAGMRETLAADRAAVVYYDFEGGGDDGRTVVDRAGGADGSLVGGSWTAGRWEGEGALGLRGEGGRVRTQTGEAMQAVTLMAWVRFDRLDFAINALLTPDASETGTLRWEVERGGRMRLGIGRDLGNRELDWEVVEGDPVVPVHGSVGWRLLVTTFDGEVVRHFCDGVPAGSGAAFRPVALRIGAADVGNGRGDQARGLAGALDEFAIFSRAMSPEEIREIYEKGKQ